MIAMGPVPHRATVLIRDVVDFAKEDDLKQIVELPALNSTESRVAVSSLLETMTETMIRTPTASISRCQRVNRYYYGEMYKKFCGEGSLLE